MKRRVTLRVTPHARQARVLADSGDVYRVYVTAPAEQGKATEAALVQLALFLEVPRRTVQLVYGMTSREKVVEIDEELSSRG